VITCQQRAEVDAILREIAPPAPSRESLEVHGREGTHDGLVAFIADLFRNAGWTVTTKHSMLSFDARGVVVQARRPNAKSRAEKITAVLNGCGLPARTDSSTEPSDASIMIIVGN